MYPTITASIQYGIPVAAEDREGAIVGEDQAGHVPDDEGTDLGVPDDRCRDRSQVDSGAGSTPSASPAAAAQAA